MFRKHFFQFKKIANRSRYQIGSIATLAVVALVAMASFQNCSGGFQTLQSSSLGELSSSLPSGDQIPAMNRRLTLTNMDIEALSRSLSTHENTGAVFTIRNSSLSDGVMYPEFLPGAWKAPGSLARTNIFLREFPVDPAELPPDIGSIHYAMSEASTADPKSGAKNREGKLAFYDSPWYRNTGIGWAADNTNYYNKWNCKSDKIKFIRKLGILPAGTHHPMMYKDSLFMAPNEYSGGYPVIYFSQGLLGADERNVPNELTQSFSSVFSFKKAYFNRQFGKWFVSDVASVNTTHGISSQDGSRDDFMMNVYHVLGKRENTAPGLGPASYRPPGDSEIVGLSTNKYSDVVPFYPLFGNGPLGLTTIILNPLTLGQPSTGSEVGMCLHQNPSFFNFDSEGKPQGFVAYLSHGTNSYASNRAPCYTGNGITLYPGNYTYKLDSTLGWILDSTLPVENCLRGHDLAMNYIQGSAGAFFQGDFTWGTIHKFEKKGPNEIPAPIRACQVLADGWARRIRRIVGFELARHSNRQLRRGRRGLW